MITIRRQPLLIDVVACALRLAKARIAMPDLRRSNPDRWLYSDFQRVGDLQTEIWAAEHASAEADRRAQMLQRVRWNFVPLCD